ncbi:MAG TPA: hypothetical protein V6C86_24280 [Oculatellaceae cyanobacterium]
MKTIKELRNMAANYPGTMNYEVQRGIFDILEDLQNRINAHLPQPAPMRDKCPKCGMGAKKKLISRYGKWATICSNQSCEHVYSVEQ